MVWALLIGSTEQRNGRQNFLATTLENLPGIALV